MDCVLFALEDVHDRAYPEISHVGEVFFGDDAAVVWYYLFVYEKMLHKFFQCSADVLLACLFVLLMS